MDRQRFGVIAALGTAQTLAWGSSYYLPAILADAIARDLGISSNWFFAAFSASLVISGLLGPRVGRQIDRVGGRQVLCMSNLLLAGGLALLGASTSIWMMVAAWLLLGVGMGFGLYDAAFGALGRIYGRDARSAITGITLIAGFASTVGWPLSSLGPRYDRVARHLLCLGACAYRDRTAAQCLAAAGRDRLPLPKGRSSNRIFRSIGRWFCCLSLSRRPGR